MNGEDPPRAPAIRFPDRLPHRRYRPGSLGRSFAAARAAAGLGLQSLIVSSGQIRETARRSFQLEAADPEAATVAWLNELIFAFEMDGWVFARFEVCTAPELPLQATGHGETIDNDRHQLGTAVKAATYHELDVHQSPAGTRIRVILDL